MLPKSLAQSSAPSSSGPAGAGGGTSPTCIPSAMAWSLTCARARSSRSFRALRFCAPDGDFFSGRSSPGSAGRFDFGEGATTGFVGRLGPLPLPSVRFMPRAPGPCGPL